MNETFEQHPAFSIVRRLAVGGMGEVLLARFVGNEHVGPGLVVVKRTLTDHPNRDYQDQMLREEGRVAVRLRHANLVETYAMDELGGHPLLVMELLAGRSMAQVLGNAKRAKTPTPVGVALQVLHGAACGLHFAHTLRVGGQPLGLVHRDVSPANIFVTYDGKVKVIDFGVAKAQDSEIKTSTGILKGKLGYMSPEHAKGETLDPRADVWSLGVVLWESLVTDRLFGGQNPAMTLFQITQAPQDPPSVRRPDVPPEVDALCMRLLAKDRDQRFASCAEVVRAIEQLPPSLWRDTDVGAFLSQRFPDDAATGQQELAERARMVRPRPIPAGILESEVIPESDESQVATLIADGRALVRQALALSALEDPPHTPASVTPRSPVVHSADANKTVALKLSDVPLAEAATTSSLSGHPGDTLADIPVVPQRAPSLSPSFASPPPSLASPAAPSFAPPPALSFAPPPAPSFAPPPAPSFAPPPAPSF
ncbi:MAG: serine/threonine-protein kinase, partial [Myxococcota bacterium]